VGRVVCEIKHMGSRAVVVLARDTRAAAQRFGVKDGRRGLIYTRTGRQFFDDQALEAALLDRLEQALTASNFWVDFNTDWVCLDAELMPWSAKAKNLILNQYAPAGRSGRTGLGLALAALEKAARIREDRPEASETAAPSSSTADLQEIISRYRRRLEAVHKYTEVYRGYCWEVNGLEDYRLAPFHILATEGRV
jgi:protein phosphatase